MIMMEKREEVVHYVKKEKKRGKRGRNRKGRFENRMRRKVIEEVEEM